MSTGKRAYDLLRGYVHQEWERIKGVERSDAERELEESARRTNVRNTSTDFQEPRSPETRKERARKLLGVPENAPFEDVQKQYERLKTRSDPANFPEGSPARVEAAEISKRAAWAYQVLSEDVDSTERRFRTLEIEP